MWKYLKDSRSASQELTINTAELWLELFIHLLLELSPMLGLTPSHKIYCYTRGHEYLRILLLSLFMGDDANS